MQLCKFVIFIEERAGKCSSFREVRSPWRDGKDLGGPTDLFGGTTGEHFDYLADGALVATAAEAELFSDRTFSPREEWGCRFYEREIKVLRAEGVALPVEYEENESLEEVRTAHKRSLVLSDAIVALTYKTDGVGGNGLSPAAIVANVLALPAEAVVFREKPRPPDFNDIQELEFDYSALTRITHRHSAAVGRTGEDAAQSHTTKAFGDNVGFIHSFGHFAMDVPGGRMVLTGSTPAHPNFGELNATVLVVTSTREVTTEVEWTSPSRAAQCLIDDLPIPTHADHDRLQKQESEKEVFLKTVVLEGGGTTTSTVECNLFYLKMSGGRFLRMYATRNEPTTLMKIEQFFEADKQRPYSSVSFSNWKRGGTPPPVRFGVRPEWHCHREAETRDARDGSVLDFSEDEAVSRPGPGALPAHAKSLLLKDSLFSFSGALGQYKMLFIPFLALPGELDLAVARPPNPRRHDLWKIAVELCGPDKHVKCGNGTRGRLP